MYFKNIIFGKAMWKEVIIDKKNLQNVILDKTLLGSRMVTPNNVLSKRQIELFSI